MFENGIYRLLDQRGAGTPHSAGVKSHMERQAPVQEEGLGTAGGGTGANRDVIISPAM